MSEMNVRFTPKYWLNRADEARVLADEMTSAHNREIMLRIANDYLKLADCARTNPQHEPERS